MRAFVAELDRGDGPVRATGIADPRLGSWIVGDVRLDGREALRAALGAAGHATNAAANDLDLVMLAWTAWREAATERLRGDYSFALWDGARRVLFCARDPLGVRPLYFADLGRTFVCGNVLDHVRGHARVTSRLHEPAIVSFLRWGCNVDTSTTTFADVRRLPPGHQMIVGMGTGVPAPRRYWAFPAPEPLRLRRDDEYIERFRDVLGEALRDRLRSDRAAILLSGGLDSTCLAATARRVAPGVELSAWTHDMGPAAPPAEVALASTVAAGLGIAHDVARVAGLPLAHLDAPGTRTPEPIDEPEWSFWIGQLERIAKRAPVLVMGEDGDALFRPPGLLGTLRAWPVHDVISRVLSYTVSHRRLPYTGFGLRRRLSGSFHRREPPPPEWIRRDLLARTGEANAGAASTHRSRPEAVRYLSAPVWQAVLESTQRAYTGADLDMVWPLLDTRLIEFVFSIPPVPWCQNKELVRRAFRGDLPDEVLKRPKSPLNRFIERRVAIWRASRRPEAIALGNGVREFVDSGRVADTLNRGSVWDVSAAWRVLALDHWLRNLSGCERPGIT